MDVPVCQTGQSDFQRMHCATDYSIGPDPTKPDSPVLETGGSKISRTLDETSGLTMTDPDDWRTPLVRYLENPSLITDRKNPCRALKYVKLDNTLYS
jgi:hypothetical protein